MGCNCNKGNKSYKYRYISPTGKVSTYESEVQARAAQIKNKGGRYAKVAK